MMKKEWQSGGLCLLILGGLLAGCLSGCRSTEPLPDKVATTGVHTVSTTATAPVDTTTKAPSKTNPDPTGYEDVGYDDEDWPWRVFYSVEGFVHWIENPNLKAEKNPLKPEKDEYGLDVYKKAILTLCILTINRCLPPIDFICYRLCRRIGSWILCI